MLNSPALGVDLTFSPDDLFVGTLNASGTRLHHFRGGEELRTLVHHAARRGYYPSASGCLDPEERLCAIVTRDGIALVDVARGEEAALLPLTKAVPQCFDSEGALWTHGGQGLLHWPLTIDEKTGQRCFGPPKWVFGTTITETHGSSKDARVVAVPLPFTTKGAVLFHRESKRLLHLGPQEDVRSCAVSPDGRWVATGSHTLHEGAGAKVWDAQDGRHVKDLSVNCGAVRFSPDGKWLLTTGGEPRLWAVGTWKEGPSLGGTPSNSCGVFSRDDKLLALGDKPGVVRLIVTDTGVEIARLTVPEQTRLRPCCFTPDGTQLIAAGAETRFLYIFDLRAIRVGLTELDLDWEAPPLPAGPRGANATPLAAAPLSIHFDLGDLRQWSEADALVKQAVPRGTSSLQQSGAKEHAKALESLLKAVKIAPSHATAQINLAWLLLTGPKELRDAVPALAAARKAVELDPLESNYLLLLGVALYYTGQFAEAIPVLERGLREQTVQADAFELFFLAMCHHRLGDSAKAKDCHERGKQWFQKYKGKLLAGWDEKVTAFQAESESVLAHPPGQAKK